MFIGREERWTARTAKEEEEEEERGRTGDGETAEGEFHSCPQQ